MEMAEDNISRVLQGLKDLLTNRLANGHLQGMRQQSMTVVAQSHSRVDKYLPVFGLDDAAQPTNA